METWRVIPSLANVNGQASSYGRIRVGPYYRPMPNGGERSYVTSPTFGQLRGDRFYVMIQRKNFKISRLVCEAFHGPPRVGANYCLHKDENARNNKPSNLKWGTQKENLNAPGFLSYCRSRTGDQSPFVKGRKGRRRNEVR